MPKRCYALIAVAAAVLGLTLAQPAVSAAAPVRIMPLGDSITAGPGCWRAYLWDRLQRTGYTNIDFVGTQPGGGCSVPFDGDHEGHGGYAATGIADQNQLPPWLAAARPDVVLMHLGTNDLWGGTISTEAILAAYSKLVDQMRASNPDMKVIVAQIIPMEPSGCAACAQRVVALDTAIPGWAAAKTTARSPITVVDQWTGFSAAADTSDGVHPIDSGFRKMADRWYPAVAAALGTPVPPSSPTTTTTTTSPSPGGACTATYAMTGQWTGGFQAEVTIRNGTSATASRWTATFGLAAGQRIGQAWNATVTQDGAAVTARNADWNGTLVAGASATFGFLASGGAPEAVPAVSCAMG
ncbi:cellulose binding domain-containing protein [Amycolatopsis kentuckyensis]|uniref:cellulose binding domain-containing protein n=1 Tax=Amycolatopsis kentuckyensis TaxID=218823 RepID=UPI000A36E2D8|nr:cellulose binding domain-containing protein [Amycolatopsis kentuckyensis]